MQNCIFSIFGLVVPRAANLVNIYIEFKFEFSLFYEFELNIFNFWSSSSSPAKIYQVFSSSENEVMNLA